MKTKIMSLFISLIMLLLVSPRKVNADNGMIDNNSGQTSTTITFTPNDSKPDTNGNGESGNNGGDSNNNGSDIDHGTENGEDIPGNGDSNDPLLPDNSGNVNSNPPIQENYANGIAPNGVLPQTDEKSSSIVLALGIIALLAGVVINKYANERGKNREEY